MKTNLKWVQYSYCGDAVLYNTSEPLWRTIAVMRITFIKKPQHHAEIIHKQTGIVEKLL